jgi:hypothetical protein
MSKKRERLLDMSRPGILVATKKKEIKNSPAAARIPKYKCKNFINLFCTIIP